MRKLTETNANFVVTVRAMIEVEVDVDVSPGVTFDIAASVAESMLQDQVQRIEFDKAIKLLGVKQGILGVIGLWKP